MPASGASKPSIADTFTRLLRLQVATWPELTRAQVMEESEARLSAVARSGSPAEQWIAARILDTPLEFRRWEAEYAGLMQGVVDAPRPGLRVPALLSVCFSLVHRKALFETLRRQAMRGDERRQLIRHFHGGCNYSRGMIAEHGNYLRCAASLICAAHIGETLLEHQAFGVPLRAYEQRFGEFFRSYCSSIIVSPGATEPNSIAVLLPSLKEELLAVRARLRAMPARPPEPRLPTR
jgi:hypothetical protein